MPFEPLGSLLAWQPPAIPYWIGNHILPQSSKICIFAGPKKMKSILAQQICFCLSSGEPFLGYTTVQCKVGYLQCEIGKAEFQKRVWKMSHNIPTVPNASLFFDTNLTFKLDRAKDLLALENSIIRNNIQVLVLDPWYKMLTVEDNAAYHRTGDTMDYLIQKLGISIIMIHHDTVPFIDQAGNEVQRFHPRGPRTDVEGWFDTIIQMTGNIENDDRKLSFISRHSPDLMLPVEITLNRSRLWFEVL